MKLQLALDELSLQESINIIKKIYDYIDIIEVGTPFIYREGLCAVKKIKKAFPKKEVLADMKIMDAGYYETKLALEAGADYVTVLAVTDILTIEGCLNAAEKFKGKIIADMIGVNNIEECVLKLEGLGVHGIAVHTGTDQQAVGRRPIDDLKTMSSCRKTSEIFVAGGIDPVSISEYLVYKPDVIIAGSGICCASNPFEVAKQMKEIMTQS